LSEKNSRPLFTTLLPIERRYYEVPRKQSNIEAYAKAEKERSQVGTSKLVEETLSPKRTYEKVRENPQQHGTYHRRSESDAQFPSARYFSKSNQEVASSLSSSPFNVPLTDRVSPTTFAGAQNNDSVTFNYKDNKADQRGSETSRADTDVPKIKKKQGKVESLKAMPNGNLYKIFEPATLTKASDRIPRPFSLSTDCHPPIAEALIYPTRLSSLRQNTPSYPSAYARQNIVPLAASSENPAASSIVSLRYTAQSTISPRAEPLTYSRNLSYRERAAPYSRVPQKSYQTTDPPNPLRRNSTLQNVATVHAENYSNVPVKLLSMPRSNQAAQQKPIVYSFTKRPEQLTIPPASPSRSRQGISHSSNPSRQEQVKIHSTVPIKQKQASTILNIATKREPALAYQTIPRRRQYIRHSAPTHQPEIHSNTASIEQTTAYSNSYAKRKVIPEEQNIGHPTIVQPMYASINRDQHKDTKYNSLKQDNSDDKDYSGNDSYNNDSNESNSNNDENDENNENDDDNSKNSNNRYSYNYNERYEEPIDDEPKKPSRSYKVREEIADQPEDESQNINNGASHDREAMKKVNPQYDQDQAQYIDLQSTEQDPDYDQARGQNTQHEVAEQSNYSKGDDEDLAEEADHQHKKQHTPESHNDAEGHSEEDDVNEHHVHGEKGDKVLFT
jgi:hypothetical protein